MNDFDDQIKGKKRFKFGKNWQSYLKHLNQEKINNSKDSILKFLNKKTLKGKTFIDVGSGSGLSSLSARLLGAKVHSFDFDTESVASTQYLKEKYFKDDNSWTVEQGSAIDSEYMKQLSTYDIVYSWGVLHHTGNMQRGLELVEKIVKPNGGLLYLALYNDQGFSSKAWTLVKKTYVKSPFVLKQLIILLSYFRIWGPPTIKDFIRIKPFDTWRKRKLDRGMSPHYDLIDWIGGYPFEVSTPEEIIHYYVDKGYNLLRLKTCKGGKGCNEYLFEKK